MDVWRHFIIFGVCVISTWAQSLFNKADLDVQSFSGTCSSGATTTLGLNYYRYLMLSENNPDTMYIGAMNLIFKVNRESLNCSVAYEKRPQSETTRRCRAQGKVENPDCQNHIRIIMERENDLLICGTGAYAPKTFVLTTELLTNSTYEYDTGLPCPFDPFDNYTAIQVSQGNPGNSTVAYIASHLDFLKNEPVIYREPYVGKTTNVSYEKKWTDREVKAWLNAPQFVGSFDDKKAVKFFFRELAVEADNKMYARVAQVCKYDLGGGHTQPARRKWLSFQKARLICSLPGDSPYYFDDIYDVFERDDQYYALFYKQGGYMNVSAICVYDINDINAVLGGKYAYKNSYGGWLPLPTANESNPRLDDCAAYETNPSAFTSKSSLHQLMYDSVHPMFGRPIYYVNGVQLTQITVSKPVVSDNGDISRNIYAASDSGEVYDIFMKNFSSQSSDPFITELNSIYRPFSSTRNTSYAVRDMKFLEDDTLLGFGTDVQVANLNLTQVCSQTKKLNTCIHNTRCQWNDTTDICSPVDRFGDSGAQGLTASVISKKGALESLKSFVVPPEQETFSCTEGAYATLPLQSKVEVNSEDVVWFASSHSSNANGCMTGENCLNQPLKFAVTANADLVIINVTSSDRAVYTACPASHRHIALTQYRVDTANEENQIIAVWKQSFNEWTTEFKRWKSCSQVYLDTCPEDP